MFRAFKQHATGTYHRNFKASNDTNKCIEQKSFTDHE